jgi:hypothetical protein
MEIGDPLQNKTSKEMDPAKLSILVAKLCRALDGEREEKVSGSATCFAAD